MTTKCPQGCECKRHNRTTYAGKPVASPEEKREYQRRYRAANREKLNEQSRAREKTSARRATKRRYREANREKIRAAGREYQREQRDLIRSAMWEAQGGLCCYCDLPLPRDGKVAIDHDHTCCPPMTSCAVCRRGLAHNNCNVIIGMANENWDLLAAIAARGPQLQAAARARIAGKPVQEELPLNVSPIRREVAS